MSVYTVDALPGWTTIDIQEARSMAQRERCKLLTVDTNELVDDYGEPHRPIHNRRNHAQSKA